MGITAFRSGEGISEILGEERFHRSGESALGGLSGRSMGLGGEPMIGVDMEDVPGYDRDTTGSLSCRSCEGRDGGVDVVVVGASMRNRMSERARCAIERPGEFIPLDIR